MHAFGSFFWDRLVAVRTRTNSIDTTRKFDLTSDGTNKSGDETEILVLPIRLVMGFSLPDPVDPQLRAATVKVTALSEFLRSGVPDGEAAGNEH
jgi:hypothetical protein